MPKAGTKLAKIRMDSATLNFLFSYRDEVIRHPVDGMLAFQKRLAVNLTLDDVCNFDESMVDLTDYADAGNYLMLDGWPGNVLVPYEQSPHFTLIVGFCGKIPMVAMLIRIGPDEEPPHPFHAEHLKTNKIIIAQSPTGWVNDALKLEFVKAQLKDPDVPFGQRPLVLNIDGHSTNTCNLELSRLLQKHKVDTHAQATHPTRSSAQSTCKQVITSIPRRCVLSDLVRIAASTHVCFDLWRHPAVRQDSAARRADRPLQGPLPQNHA